MTKLTKTERKIFKLLGHGYSNKEIAYVLDLSVRTIETHRAHIAKKTGFTGSRLIAYASRQLVKEYELKEVCHATV